MSFHDAASDLTLEQLDVLAECNADDVPFGGDDPCGRETLAKLITMARRATEAEARLAAAMDYLDEDADTSRCDREGHSHPSKIQRLICALSYECDFAKQRQHEAEREARRLVAYVPPGLAAATTLTITADVAPEREPQEMTCEHCGKRPGWSWWSNGGMDFARGYKSAWCEQCCTETQLSAARAQVARIPELERRLDELLSHVA